MTNRCGYCALLGRPNVGKSTLLNRLVGQKLAITSRKPQTTRHNILGINTIERGQVIYVDTPGMHLRGEQPMNRYLNRTARSAGMQVDLVLFVVEALVWTDEDQAVLQTLAKIGAPVILLVNKIDQVKDKNRLLPYLAELSGRHAFAEVIPVSAKAGDNIGGVEKTVLERLPEGENVFPDDQLSDRNERFFASELIREQLTRRYGKEIPYALTVEIEQFKDEGKLYRIAGVIWVEKKGQKNIIIGNKGESLKTVGTQARLGMEAFFEKKVFLQLWVKVRKSWSSDESALSHLGYTD
ncbi:MAG: GTPase Era [Gammaproteobacteria bacterium]|nr:GTPase Era [Gammaproteobacteria bacterium]